MPSSQMPRSRSAEPGQILAELRREAMELFGRLDQASTPSPHARRVFPRVDLYEAPDAYILTASLPGVDQDSLQITVEASTVVLSGERTHSYGRDEARRLYLCERGEGKFRRSVDLPKPVEVERAQAIQKNGLLMLRLPKRADARRRSIVVEGG